MSFKRDPDYWNQLELEKEEQEWNDKKNKEEHELLKGKEVRLMWFWKCSDCNNGIERNDFSAMLMCPYCKKIGTLKRVSKKEFEKLEIHEKW